MNKSKRGKKLQRYNKNISNDHNNNKLFHQLRIIQPRCIVSCFYDKIYSSELLGSECRWSWWEMSSVIKNSILLPGGGSKYIGLLMVGMSEIALKKSSISLFLSAYTRWVVTVNFNTNRAKYNLLSNYKNNYRPNLLSTTMVNSH